jgi:hypothetical protein
MMLGAGVGLLAGTDLPANAANGTIHDELGESGQPGTIQKGKIAPLVLLEANPLEDIRNTSKVSAVILNGQMVKP